MAAGAAFFLGMSRQAAAPMMAMANTIRAGLASFLRLNLTVISLEVKGRRLVAARSAPHAPQKRWVSGYSARHLMQTTDILSPFLGCL